jgi:hypothetical protein
MSDHTLSEKDYRELLDIERELIALKEKSRWHDAKEPPEEIGVYLVEWRERPYLWEVGYWNGNCWDSCHWKRPFPTQPTRYRKGDLK